MKPDLVRAAEAVASGEVANGPPNVMRFREFLPFLEREPAMMPRVTPLVPLTSVAAELGLEELLVKDEGEQPGGSLKARPSAFAAAHARAQGFGTIACASSGNAAISVAAAAAAEGLRAVAFVSAEIPLEKLERLRSYGPEVVVVEGTYADAYDRCDGACATNGWFNRNCGQNALLIEGKKTCGLEVAEQTRASPPGWVAVPVGDGCTVAGIWKGLREAVATGLAPGVPRVLAVQAKGSAVIAEAWREKRPPAEVEPRYAAPSTCAESIAVSRPRSSGRALAAIADSRGDAVTVSDAEIVAARDELLRSGLDLELASAASLAGVRAAVRSGLIGAGSRVVAIGTATGAERPGR